MQVTREALSNVGRHADATSCRVTLRRGSTGAELEIDDDGGGFDAGSAARGWASANLRDRVAAIGGELADREHRGRGNDGASGFALSRS